MTERPAYLIDERWGVAYSLHRDRTGIGRDPSNPVIVRDMSVSRFHAEVRRTGNHYVLHTLGSNATKVNGQPLVSHAQVREGDVIEIAYTRLRFTDQALPRDVMLAPEQPRVDRELAEGKTQFREIVSTKRLQQLRRPVRGPLWKIVAFVVAAGGILGLTIHLVAGK